MKTHRLLILAALGLASCKSAPPGGGPSGSASATGGGGAGGGGGGEVCVPPEVTYPPAFHPISSCCPDTMCRGRCSLGLIGQGDELDFMCHCGAVTFNPDTRVHSGPGPCAEGEECCVMPSIHNVCVPQGQCFNCTPERSGKWSLAGCCGATTPCRGMCDENPANTCYCEHPDDGGCGDGMECCLDPLTLEVQCLPWGECKFELEELDCPPEASSASVAVDCCNGWPCRGGCQSHPQLIEACYCGGSIKGCKHDQECCLGPSGENSDPATQCVPLGECPPLE